jgi:hypothetical protein
MRNQRQLAPVALPAIRCGEIDGRYIDFSADLGTVADYIPSINNVDIAIIRRDGFPMAAEDLAVAGPPWPNTLDPDGLVLTIGLQPPLGSAGRRYQLTVTVNKTLQGRIFIRDLWIDVLAAMG